MNRTQRYKITFFLVLILLIGLAGFAAFYFKFSIIVGTGIAFALLIIGRIPGFFWRDFYRGRRLMGTGDWEKSIVYFEGFQRDLKQRPWIKHLIWLASGAYTRNIEVMTLNNLGAAKINLGRLDEAELHLLSASELDNEAPLPRYNLAILEQVRGNSVRAEGFLNEAHRLGFKNTGYDKVVLAGGQILANVEGRGIK